MSLLFFNNNKNLSCSSITVNHTVVKKYISLWHPFKLYLKKAARQKFVVCTLYTAAQSFLLIEKISKEKVYLVDKKCMAGTQDNI